VKSRTSKSFRDQYRRLPVEVRRQARQAYRLWQKDPYYPSLRFKRVGVNEPIYSVRVGRHWRALGVLEDDTITWRWIGSHADYDNMIGGTR
jgi:hypothetical protein